MHAGARRIGLIEFFFVLPLLSDAALPFECRKFWSQSAIGQISLTQPLTYKLFFVMKDVFYKRQRDEA